MANIPETTPQQAEAYANRMSDLFGSQTTVMNGGIVLEQDPLRGQIKGGYANIPKKYNDTRIAISVGDELAADTAIDKLVEIRSKLGLKREDFGFSLGAKNDGQILISAKDIARYEQEHGEGSLFKKLETVKSDLQAVVHEAQEIGNRPGIKKDLGIESTNFNYDEKKINNDKFSNRGYNLDEAFLRETVGGMSMPSMKSLPGSIWEGALEAAREIRTDAESKHIDPQNLKEFRDVSGLGGNKGYTDEKAAAYLIALSMDHLSKDTDGSIRGAFTNYVGFNSSPQAPELVREAADKIYRQWQESEALKRQREEGRSATPPSPAPAAPQKDMRAPAQQIPAAPTQQAPAGRPMGVPPKGQPLNAPPAVSAEAEIACKKIQGELVQFINNHEINPDGRSIKISGTEMQLYTNLNTLSDRCDNAGLDFKHYGLKPNPKSPAR